jgi:hypothetical protein
MRDSMNKEYCVPFQVGIYLFTGNSAETRIRPDISRKFCEICGKEIIEDNQVCKGVEKTAEEWLKTPEFKDIEILDPDGWNRKPEFWDSSWNEKITKDEMWNRVNQSTIKIKASHE